MDISDAIHILRNHNTSGASVIRITEGKVTEHELLAYVLNACEQFIAEKEEYKRLLKAAVEDIHELLCDRKNLDGIGQSCNLCSYTDNCSCCNRCDIIPELRTWRYADEALKLIGDEDV